jgi:hypothetical protein
METVQELRELQFRTIFRNRFGVMPEEIGLEVDGYEATGNGHTIRLHVENDIVIDWKLDGERFSEHEVLQRNGSQPENLTHLVEAMGVSVHVQ